MFFLIMACCVIDSSRIFAVHLGASKLWVENACRKLDALHAGILCKVLIPQNEKPLIVHYSCSRVPSSHTFPLSRRFFPGNLEVKEGENSWSCSIGHCRCNCSRGILGVFLGSFAICLGRKPFVMIFFICGPKSLNYMFQKRFASSQVARLGE